MRIIKFILALLFVLPTIAVAGWQVVSPQAAAPSEPFFQAGSQADKTFTSPTSVSRTSVPVSAYTAKSFPNRYASLGRPAAVYAVSISGSLKENLERIMDRYHWRVVWKAGYDYNFDGRVTGSSLPSVIEKILKPFPLQAQMYMSNRTMIIMPRTTV